MHAILDAVTDGLLFARQPQLRLTYGLPFGKDTLNFMAAVQPASADFATGRAL